jgi:hypothetical protein
MSTRCNIHFTEGGFFIVANIYRGIDGGPSSVLKDLNEYFQDLMFYLGEPRFNEPELLAARYLVWQAELFSKGKGFNFLSLGICSEDHEDIEYIYTVACFEDKLPAISYEEVKD